MAASGLIGAAGSALYATNIETRWLEVSRTVIRLPKLTAPVRILHLSDLHSSPEVPNGLLWNAARAAIAAKPDLICLTGDYVSNFVQHDEKGLRETFRLLLGAAPVHAVMGNHDSGSWDGTAHTSKPIRDLLESCGVTVLHNRSARFDARNGASLSLIGVGDLWNYEEFQPADGFRDADPELPAIVLSHNPDSKKPLAEHPWDLMLSGHTHGGQVLVPFVEPTWLPVVDRRFVAGRYDWHGRQLYITRGVGSTKGIRFRCRPEVSILDLAPAESI